MGTSRAPDNRTGPRHGPEPSRRADPEIKALLEAVRAPGATHRGPASLLLRGLGALYAVGFLILARQGPARFGSRGLLPADAYLDRVAGALGPGWPSWSRLPTLFWMDCSDAALVGLAWAGVAGGLAMVAGVAHSALLAALWALYLSFVHVGQDWYGYGWETLLLEVGFLSIFLGPLTRLRLTGPPPVPVIWLLRWTTFRLWFGAGLIKIRGGDCWHELTCLQFHFETQPNPNPLSWWLHQAPAELLMAGVAWNHFIELIVPFAVLTPWRRARAAAGALLISFQLMIILSGNLAFLNHLTIVLTLCCFDDRRPAARAERRPLHLMVLALLVGLVVWRSVGPVGNMLSSEQVMNTSYDPLHLVNTYGAFGSVGEQRREVVIQGTSSREQPRWLDYELPCKPGDVSRRPCVITPYHYRLDWQIWFVPLGRLESHLWLVHLVARLLDGDPLIAGLLAYDPFGETPPQAIRVAMYRYRFAPQGSPDWWEREYEGELIRPLTRDDPQLTAILEQRGWRAAATSPPAP